ncbi:MAG: CDP-diacylglycerol--glycerol-3-phosphate 3-phosphatidyltransferase [Candidatus Omnitrophica bacterium]|nr:CDP-diacylglycerol--glycerol-3-phosphate 3-phosphatidyltransferase [Candidatus Omnitrophota bacterium]
MMSLPNILTISRIALTVFFMIFLFSAGALSKYIALFLFITASITDLLDGRLARQRGQISNFGIIMDPVADKVLVLSAFFSFAYLRLVSLWMVLLIAVREAAITGIRLFALSSDQALPASRSGKHKTVSQIVSILAILLFLCVRETVVAYKGVFPAALGEPIRIGISYMMFVTVALTLFSGVRFLIRNRDTVSVMDGLIKSAATVCGIGYIPKVPGLMGSAVGLAIWFFMRETGAAYLVVAFMVTLSGFLVCGKAEKALREKDSQRIVIDETSGMLIVLAGIRGPVSIAIVLFVLFRLLDMTKPGWFGLIQRAPGSIGVMGDDIAVAVFINVCARLYLMLTSGITA